MSVNSDNFARDGFYPFDDSLLTEIDIIRKCSFNTVEYVSKKFIKMSHNPNLFNVLHINCRSLLAHHGDVDLLLHNLNNLPSVCVLSETWLAEGSLQLPFDNYIQHNKIRGNNQRGGGVSILVQSSIRSSEFIVNVSPVSFEFICRQVFISSESIICIGVYRPPSTDCDVFLDEINNLLHSVAQLAPGKRLLVAGDFNIDILTASRNANVFLDTFMSYSLYPTIYMPTRPSSKSLIDNIFISWPSFVSSHILSSDISDHLPILCCSDFVKSNSSVANPLPILQRNFNEHSVARFKSSLASVDWEQVYRLNDPQDAYTKFFKLFNLHFNSCFPLKPSLNFKKKGS